jgi:TPR repeat protein
MGRTVLAALAALLVLSLGCSSYYIRRADSAAEAGDYETARDLYHHAATNGMNGYARLQLAKIYDEGLDGEPNPAEALRWYRASADLGNGYAQFRAGQLLEDGGGSPPDEQAAAKYYEAAAGQGDSLVLSDSLR